MGTPTFINFSRVSGRVEDTAQRIQDGMGDAWRCELDRFAYLRASDDPYDGGYELDGELAPCEGLAEIARLVETGRPFGLAFLCRGTRATFAVYFTEMGPDAHTVTAAVETSFVYHRDDEYSEPGRWFEGWLTSLVIAVQASVCAYGNLEIIDKSMDLATVLEGLRRPRYEALEPGQILDRLRTGDLLELPDPVFHAISIDLIGIPEVRRLIKTRPHAAGLEHKVAPGYHILSNI